MLIDMPPPSAIHYEALENPFLQYRRLLPFDQIQPNHFLEALEALFIKILPAIEKLEALESPSWETLLLPLEEVEEEIYRVVGPMLHLKRVKDSDDLRSVWGSVEPLINEIYLRINQSRPLYLSLKAIKESDEWKTFSSAQKRVVEKRLTNARLKGVGLNEEALETFNELLHELSSLQTDYVANMSDATKTFSLVIENRTELAGVPYDVLKLASELYNREKNENDPLSTHHNGPWKLNLTAPIYLPIIRHCDSRTLREMIYRKQIHKASEGEFGNTENLQKQLAIRKRLSNLLGFSTYAEKSLATKMAPNVETVQGFLDKLRDASWIEGRQDLLEVQLFASRSGFREPFMPWDYPYWSERLWEERYHLSEEEIKPYFPLQKVLRGVFDLCHKLFGITIVKPEDQPPVWDKHVIYYLVFNEIGEQVASFYLDPFIRPSSKRSGAWNGTALNRTLFQGELQLPLTYIVTNFTPPTADTPSLLAFREIRTLFHEFGHALQHMLTTVDYGSISGTNGIEWDAIEIPSKFMENWCYHKETLKKISSHIQTGDPLPDVVIDKLLSARNFNAGTNMLAQLKYSLCDLALHHNYDPEGMGAPFDIWYDTCLTTSHLPCLEEDRFLCSFHHIFGGDSYSAGYYSYKWSEVLSADAFEAFIEAGLENGETLRTVGKAFQQTFLELGGSLHPMEVFEKFRGREPTLAPLLEQSGFSRAREKL